MLEIMPALFANAMLVYKTIVVSIVILGQIRNCAPSLC